MPWKAKSWARVATYPAAAAATTPSVAPIPTEPGAARAPTYAASATGFGSKRAASPPSGRGAAPGTGGEHAASPVGATPVPSGACTVAAARG